MGTVGAEPEQLPAHRAVLALLQDAHALGEREVPKLELTDNGKTAGLSSNGNAPQPIEQQEVAIRTDREVMDVASFSAFDTAEENFPVSRKEFSELDWLGRADAKALLQDPHPPAVREAS